MYHKNWDGIRKKLEEKRAKYEENGNTLQVSVVDQILEKGPQAVAATVRVNPFEGKKGSTRRIKLKDIPGPVERTMQENPLTQGMSLRAIKDRMERDPAWAAAVEHDMRRPKGISSTSHHIAGRAAVKEPMLNADPQSIRNGLDYKEVQRNNRLPKDKLYASLVVKPVTRAAAKAEGHTSWVERRWTVHTLKYARGFVIVTDKGDESRVFPTYGELKSAIQKSGWRIIR